MKESASRSRMALQTQGSGFKRLARHGFPVVLTVERLPRRPLSPRIPNPCSPFTPPGCTKSGHVGVHASPLGPPARHRNPTAIDRNLFSGPLPPGTRVPRHFRPTSCALPTPEPPPLHLALAAKKLARITRNRLRLNPPPPSTLKGGLDG